MTGLDFLEKMNDIDSELLEASESYGKKNNIVKFRWLTAVASVAVVATLALAVRFVSINSTSNTESAFAFRGVSYELAELNDLNSYKIRPARSIESEYEVKKEDCGAKIGTVKVKVDGKVVECDVYQLASEEDGVRILAYPDGRYVVYVEKEEQ